MRLIITIIALLFSNCFWAQTALHRTSVKPQKNVATTPKDDLKVNVVQTLKKLTAMINSNSSGTAFTDRYYFTGYGGPIFSSKIELPGSEKTFIIKNETNRQKKITRWTWSSNIATVPKNTITAQLQKAVVTIDSILRHDIHPSSDINYNSITAAGVKLFLADSSGYFKTDNDSLVVSITFIKPLENTALQAADSLKKNYWPSLIDSDKSKDAVERLCKEMENEDISHDIQQDVLNEVVKAAGKLSANAAFILLMNAPYYIDVAKISNSLDPELHNKIKSMAQHLVDDYNKDHPWNSSIATEPPPPMSSVQANNSVVDNTCATNKANQMYQVNTFLYGKGFSSKDARIVYFDCQQNVYIVQTRDFIPSRTTFFKNKNDIGRWTFNTITQTSAQIAQNFGRSDKTYKVCTYCHGTGYINQQASSHESLAWQRIGNSNSYYLTDNTMTWNNTVNCPVCGGLVWY